MNLRVKEMNSLRRVIAAAILASAAITAAHGQTPRQGKKLSADEILNTEVTNCYTHVSYAEEETHEYLDECLNVRKVSVQSLLRVIIYLTHHATSCYI